MNILMENNILLKTDSYKVSHYKQYPKETICVYAYLESRGGDYPEQVFFGLQYILKKHLVGKVITKEYLEQAIQFWNQHFGYDLVDREMWQYIIDKYDGHLPIRIKAIPEGTVVPTGNVLMTVENTDPKCASLTTYLETILLQVWYPITIATNSREIKKILLRSLKRTGDPRVIKTQLHDFGFRGVSSYETSAIGACAHLTSFYGTDTISGCVLAHKYYSAKEMAANSIPASEHSTMVSWTREKEAEAYCNMLDMYPKGIIACVSDSYDIYNACEHIWGEQLHDKILARDGTLVVRSDSGDPLEVLERLMNILYAKFGGYVNEKGFKVLDKHVRLIQGDGVNMNSIKNIVNSFELNGFSTDNIVFGSGGALLQKFDRDTMRFAMKCSYVEITGMGGLPVAKDPITDRAKRNKPGRLKLVKETNDSYRTLSSLEHNNEYDLAEDQLVTVFENGKLLCEYSFDTIRANCDIDINRLEFMHIISLLRFEIMNDNNNNQNKIAIQRFVEYIQIKTVQPEPDYDCAFKFLKNYAQELGLQYRLIKIDQDRQAAVLTWLSSSTDKSILLNSHIDVVPVFEEHWIVPPFSGEIRDGKIYGRGTQDMKCVGIQYLEAIRRLKTAKYEPKRTIHCLFVPDEEIGGIRGMKVLRTLDEFKDLNVGFVLDEGLASETDVFQVFYGDRCAIWIEITVKGNTGHGSRLIENTAAEKAQFIINEMLKYRTNSKECLEKSQTTDKPLQLGNITTVNLTKMGGGVQINVVPDQYTLGFDCRIEPNSYDSFKKFLDDLIQRVPKENNNEITINYLQDSGPLVLTDIEKPSWWLNSFKRTCEEMKCKLNWTIFPAGTDARFLRNVGYPAIGFSPMINTPVLLHDHNEYLHKDVFLHGIEIYVKLIENLTSETI
ncbi:unnamed protein product [Rotaria sordida]|uniref:Nicotinamide phosphoribosyltransferase n=2 Tax=Rotaria sordida TaxID=392033 RepID=A0A813Z2C6_9BILA|nr:unnamed protein product [Rotaria sordida]